MADGAPSVSRRRSRFSFHDEGDPRFTGAPDENARAARTSRRSAEGKKRARIAFTGEEYGFGFQATGDFIERAKRHGGVADAGLHAVRGVRTEREFDPASPNARFDYEAAITQPLRTKEQALIAVKQGTADFAVIPFYSPYAGYDFEALRALSSQFTLLGIEQVDATDNLCLAVHESQLYDLIQSAHPGTGFSALQRRFRKSWGTLDQGSGNAPGADYDAEMPRAGLPIDMSDQKLIRDRIDVVFAGPEAARRCKSKLDGLRAIGVEINEIAQMVEPHRELARLARTTTNSARQTNTYFDPISGETRFFSALGAEAQSGKLFGMVLPYEVAMRSSDYVIIDHDMDDAPPTKTRFLVVEQNPDHTMFEDAYRTTDAKTRYWMRRLGAVAQGETGFLTQIARGFGGVLMAAALTLMFFGALGASNFPAAFLTDEISKWLDPVNARYAIGAGVLMGAIAWVMMTFHGGGAKGVRLMMRFRRDGEAASIGDVENFLRNYGVRHAVTRLDEDSESDRPSSVMLDVEFEPVDFVHNPITMVTRRLRGSVVNGAIKRSFLRWKNRGVTILAAMPFEPGAEQLPRQKQRRWWSEGLANFLVVTGEEFAIRMMRLLLLFGVPALLAYGIWKYLIAG